jgi:hypothetical protein
MGLNMALSPLTTVTNSELKEQHISRVHTKLNRNQRAAILTVKRSSLWYWSLI